MFKDPPETMRRIAWDLLVKAAEDIALFPIRVLAWYQDKFGDTGSMWEVYVDEVGCIWWHNPLLPSVVVRPNSDGWQLYREPAQNALWMFNEEAAYFFWCGVMAPSEDSK